MTIKSAEEFIFLSENRIKCDDYPTRSYLSQEDIASTEVWIDILTKYPFFHVKYNVLLNINLPFEIIKQLSDDLDPNVRVRVAMRGGV